MASIEEKVTKLVEPIIENLGYELYDVEYAKEGKNYFLRIFIDNEKGIDLNDCEKVNDAVAEVIKKLVNNPKFEAAIRAKINSKIDTGELETEHENLKKQLRQVLGAKNRLGQQMDNLDISDKMYDRKYQDMQDRLNGLYDEIERLESLIDDIVSRKEYIRQQKISEDGVYQYLLYFDKLYDKFTDMEKKEFMNSFVERVDIYEDEQPNGRFLKHIKFKFPVFFDGEEIQELSWDNETTVETIVLIQKKNS